MAERSDKSPAHSLRVAEPCGERHLLDRLAGRLHTGLRRLDAQPLNRSTAQPPWRVSSQFRQQRRG